MSEGVCNIVPRAEYEILGKTRNDQRWIDETIEGEVGGCQFPRPKVRPASWDVGPTNPKIVTPPPPQKRSGFVKRTYLKAKKVFRRPAVGSVEPAPQPAPPPIESPPWTANITPPPQAAPVAPPPPPKPRNLVDELLDGPPPKQVKNPTK